MATNERFQTFVYWIVVLLVWLVCALIGAVVSTAIVYVAAVGLRFSLGAGAVAVILLGIVASFLSLDGLKREASSQVLAWVFWAAR